MRTSALMIASALVAASATLAYAEQGPNDRETGTQSYEWQYSDSGAPVMQSGHAAYAATKHARVNKSMTKQPDAWEKARLEDSYEGGGS